MLKPFYFFILAKTRRETDALQKILIEEGEYSDKNYYFMQTTLKYKNTYLTYKNGNLFLTLDSLIKLNNIITGSQHIGFRDINVKPTGYSKRYMDKSLVKAAFYCLVDQFNDRIISHKDFCRTFLDQMHPFQDGNGRTCKILFADQINNT